MTDLPCNLAPSADDLLTSDVLQSFGIALNPEHNLLICLDCHSAFHAGNIERHLQDIHHLATPEWRNTLAKFMKQADLKDSYPVIDAVIPHLPGLGLKSAAGCPDCLYAAQRRSVLTHMKKKHPLSTGAVLDEVCVQCFNTGSSKKYFRVIDRAEPWIDTSSLHDVVTAALSFDWKAGTCRENPTNQRLVTPWLRRNHWHLITEGYDVDSMRAMSALPDQSMLHNTVISYFSHITDLLDVVDELTLQVVNSHDPDKNGINNTPLHAHQERQTLRNYAVPVTKLISCLLKSLSASATFKLPISDELRVNLECLASDLTSQDNIHGVLTSLWHREWKQPDTSVYAFDPTLAFLAIIHLNPKGDFSDPRTSAGTIGKLCRGIQLVTVKEIHATAVGGDYFAMLSDLGRWVVEKQPTTFSYLWSLQHYATSLAYRGLTMPKIWWVDSDSYQSLLYKGQPASIQTIQRLFQSLEQELVDLWDEKILCGASIRTDWSVLTDDLTEKASGYSFLDQNTFSTTSLMVHLFRSGGPLVLSNKAELDHRRAQAWLVELAAFEARLMVLCDMTGGAPPRGTELVSMLVRNTPTRLRNLMGMARHISIVRMYTKTSNTSQSDKLIPHALSAFCGDMVIQLHTLARPVARFLASKLYINKPTLVLEYAELLFMDHGKPFTTERLRSTMNLVTMPIFGWGVTPSHWRHVNIALRRKLCKGSKDEEEVSEFQALQSGHTRQTENSIYGLDQGALIDAPYEVLECYLQVSMEWQTVCKVPPGGLNLSYKTGQTRDFDQLVLNGILTPKGMRPNQGEIYGQLDPKFLERLLESDQRMITKQDAMKTEISQLSTEIQSLKQLLSRPNGINPRIVYSSPDEIRLVNNEIDHGPMDCGDDGGELPLSVRIDLEDNINVPTPGLSQSCPPQEIDMLDSLRNLFGTTAVWRVPEQREAIRTLTELQTDVILALRTGIGKTAIAVLSTTFEQGYTIIVIPLIALMNDWKARLDSLKVAYEHYASNSQKHLTGNCNIILVSTEVAAFPTFKAAVRLLNERKPVIRMVFDEAQFFFTDTSYRHSLTAPFKHRVVPCQIVLMSGTIPPLAEDTLKELFVLSSPRIFRTNSSRTELYFDRHNPFSSLNAALTTCEKLIKEHSKSWTPVDRYLIFVRSIADGRKIASTLGLPFYYGTNKKDPSSPSLEERSRMYSDWESGKTIGLVATTALSAGNDYSYVRLIVHVDVPYEMVTYIQQTGRGGRDGKLAHCILLPVHRSKRPEVEGTVDLKGVRAMDFAYAPLRDGYPRLCMRYPATEFLDGQAFCCADLENAVLCGPCVRHFGTADAPAIAPKIPKDASTDAQLKLPPPLVGSPLKRRLSEAFGEAQNTASKRYCAELQDMSEDADLLLKFLRRIGTGCGFCYVKEKVILDHGGRMCPLINASSRGLYSFLKGQMNYPQPFPTPGRSPCYRCHIPTLGWNLLHADFGEQPCDRPSFMIPFIVAIFAASDMKRQAANYFHVDTQVDWKSNTSIRNWARSHDGRCDTKPMHLLLWYLKNYDI